MKTALVTGGTRGIGRGIAEKLRDDGWTVIVSCRTPREIPGIKCVVADNAVAEDRARLLEECGEIDLLVNNAGVAPKVRADLLDMSEESMSELMQINLYGGTKLVSDKLFIAANSYRGKRDLSFYIVRYGNVAGSRGSVIPFFDNLIRSGKTELPVTDYRMTRFWISLEVGVQLVIKALEEARGGETFISKIPSFKITSRV